MNPVMRLFCLLSCFLTVLSLPAPGVAADDGADKRYALPERGFFKLRMPAGWTDRVEQKSQAVPLISFGPSQGKPFIVTVTPQSGAGKPLPSRDELRKRVEYAAEGIRPLAVEKVIKVIEFAGASGAGFYFFATDSAPQPGEYKFMNKGMLRVGDLAVDFTILTNEGQDAVVRAALDMLKGAAYVGQ